ncbi:hypothetical protein ACJX0J_015538, partial [Zea mays]
RGDCGLKLNWVERVINKWFGIYTYCGISKKINEMVVVDYFILAHIIIINIAKICHLVLSINYLMLNCKLHQNKKQIQERATKTMDDGQQLAASFNN